MLVSFEQQLPEGTNLLDGWELLYERSIACVGVIKDWLTLAYRTSLKAGAESVSIDHLERTARRRIKPGANWKKRASVNVA
ncbi:MAG: hypothetical protein JOY61_25785 [Chloroflexi bacterium]|nr:hypothetical protein [Chloroflexota bacterium]